MKQVERSALLPYTARQMFDVVNDVAAYSEFLPWCAESVVLSESAEEMTARLVIARGVIRQGFITRNKVRPPNRIDMYLVDGPFTVFEGHWQFESLGDAGCRTAMQLRFGFNSRLANLALGRVFERAADTLVDAFYGRAGCLYG